MIQIIGWTILHSLWQVALIACIYLLLKHSWQAATALKKYYLAVTSFVATFLSTIFTFGYLFQQENWTITAITDSALIPITSEIPTTTSTSIIPNEVILETTLSFTDYLTICLPYLVAFWGMGMLYFTIRFLKNLYGVQQLENVDNELISAEWLAKIKTFKTQLNIQKDVQVFLSLHVKEPITFGHFKPIILLPISLITGFDTAAVETILLHELAHIKRHDYLVNLGQSIIEIILFYHPLVWWLSKDIRELREHCCDDLVLSLSDNRATYVETLTALQWRKVGGVTNRLSLSASGGDAGFTRRIKRMFGVEEKRGSFRQLMGVALVLLIFAVGGIWLKKDLAVQNKSTADYTFIVDKNTSVKELDELTEKMRDLEIFKSFCWLKDDDILTSINGEFYDAEKNIQYFDIADIQQTPTQFIFENGLITEIRDLYHQQSIYLKSANQSSILINAKTTKAELATWAKMVNEQGIQFDFKQSVFDETGKVIELRGNYNSGDKGGDFFAMNLPCVNVKFELYKDQLSEPIFSYPCKEKGIDKVDMESISIDDLTDRPIKKEKGQIYWIDGKTLENDKEQIIEELSALEIFDGFSFNPETNSFNGSYFYKEGKTTFIEVEDVAKRPIKIVIKNGYVTELKIAGDAKDGVGFIRNEFLDKIPNWEQNNSDTLVYLVSNEMTRVELYEMIAKVNAHSQVRINLDPLKTKFDEQDKLVAISGKYYYERSTRTPIQTFEVADLGQFQLQFQSHPAISFAPAYYNRATNKFIQVTDHYSAIQAFAVDAAIAGILTIPSRTYKDIHAILIINEYTNIDDLKTFAEKILPNNIIFRYQDSKFRPDGTIAKLIGDFLGDSRISEPFYVDDLRKYQVKLRVDKNYIYQPEITRQVKTNSAPLSYKITNWKALGLDSLEYSLANERHRNYGNGIAKLIPPYVAVNDSVRAMNPIYRANMEKAKSVFVNEQKVAKKDLPIYMQNQLQEAIKTDIPKTKRYSKTDTNVDWLYWGDQKINLGEAYKKEENGNLKWDAPKLEISKEVWNNNKDRPFIFQIDGDWYRVEDLDMVVLVPYKANPASVNFHKNYTKALTNKAGSVFKLLDRAKEKDHLYFEKMEVGLPINISMAIKIIEDNSIGNVPKMNELNDVPKEIVPVLAEVLGRKEIVIDTFKNWIQWDNLKFNFSATFKEGRNGKTKLQTPTLEITKQEWQQLQNQPFIFHLDKEWFKVKTIKEIVFVPHKKDPKSFNVQQDYQQIIKDKNHRVSKVLATANIGDYIYFETIDVGKDFTFGLVVKIIDNEPANSTGFIPKEAIHFDEKDALMSMGAYPPAFQNTTSPKLKIDAFVPEHVPSSSGLLWSNIPDKKEGVYIIDGMEYKGDLPDKKNDKN